MAPSAGIKIIDSGPKSSCVVKVLEVCKLMANDIFCQALGKLSDFPVKLNSA